MAISQESVVMTLEETFYYDPTAPSCLRWARTKYSGRSNGKPQSIKGEPAGGMNQRLHYEVYFEGRLQQAHRLVYRLEVGEIPEGMVIDHINGNRSDNRVENLRAVTSKTNARNRKKSVRNTSGVTGVYAIYNKIGEHSGYTASWQTLEGYKNHTKRFTFEKYGPDALEAAKWWREVMVDFMNADGAGYTADHGKRI